jgi:hypothetical protein
VAHVARSLLHVAKQLYPLPPPDIYRECLLTIPACVKLTEFGDKEVRQEAGGEHVTRKGAAYPKNVDHSGLCEAHGIPGNLEGGAKNLRGDASGSRRMARGLKHRILSPPPPARNCFFPSYKSNSPSSKTRKEHCA